MRHQIKDDVRWLAEAAAKGQSSYAWNIYVTADRIERVLKHLKELENRMQDHR